MASPILQNGGGAVGAQEGSASELTQSEHATALFLKVQQLQEQLSVLRVEAAGEISNLRQQANNAVNELKGQQQQAMLNADAHVTLAQPAKFSGPEAQKGLNVLEWTHQATVNLRAAGLEQKE